MTIQIDHTRTLQNGYWMIDYCASYAGDTVCGPVMKGTRNQRELIELTGTRDCSGGRLMTKAELIEAIARVTRQQKKSVAATVELTFDQIARAIRKDQRFWMPGFGTFTVRRHKARTGFNPRTKTAMTIAATRTIGFRPAPKLKKGL